MLKLQVIVMKHNLCTGTNWLLETLSEKNYNAQTVQSHLNLVTGLVAHNKNTFQLLQSSVANFGDLKYAVSFLSCSTVPFFFDPQRLLFHKSI